MTCRNHPIFKKSQCILLIWTFRLWFYRNRDFPTEFLVCKNWHSKYGVWSWPPRNAPNCSEFRSGLFRTSDLQWQICNSIFSTIVILENGSRTPELPLVFFWYNAKKKGRYCWKARYDPFSRNNGTRGTDTDLNGYQDFFATLAEKIPVSVESARFFLFHDIDLGAASIFWIVDIRSPNFMAKNDINFGDLIFTTVKYRHSILNMSRMYFLLGKI